MINRHKRLFKLSTLPLLLLSSYAYASGIQLDTSYSSAGYAWAGRAALFDDASTGYYNPALYSAFCHPEIGFSTIFADVNPDVKMLESKIVNGNNVLPTMGNDRANIGGWNVLAGMHAVLPLPYGFSAGLNVATPWGLTFNYPRSSKSRYFAQLASLKVIDVAPSISFQVMDGFSIGVGLDATYTDAKTKLAIPTLIAADTYVTNDHADKWAFGWNAGLFYRAPTRTNIGVSYHSKIEPTVNGPASAIDGITGTKFTGKADTHFIFPGYFNVSVVQEVTPCFSVLADIRFTNWSKVDKNTIKYSGDIAGEVRDVDLPLNWLDSINYAVGASYKPSDEWKLKAGFGYDETPIRNAEKRPFLIPDNNRYVIGLGAQYCVNSNLHFDAGYTAKILPRSEIRATQIVGPLVITSNARSDLMINEISFSLNWAFS